MVEFEFNRPVDVASLTAFFARCGWEDPAAHVKLEWALAASADWVVCRLDGELIGFGRTCRLDPMRRVVFDVVVDSRYKEGALRGEIVRLLSAYAGRLEEVSVFSETNPFELPPPAGLALTPTWLAAAKPPADAYLGKRKIGKSGGDA